MKFWHLESFFRDKKEALDVALRGQTDGVLTAHHDNFAALAASQDRSALDAPVPDSVVFQALSLSKKRFVLKDNCLRPMSPSDSDFGPGCELLSAADAYRRFGGDALEDALEYGSFRTVAMVDEARTLDDLEGVVWGQPSCGSGLVTECHALRQKPIKDFTPTDLRIMIGQRISLPILVPRAIAVLRATPFVDCGLYDGVLLATVLRLDGNFWKSQPGLRRDALEIAKRVKGVLSVQAAPIEQEVMESVEAFLLGHREWATVVRCQREIKEGEELLVAKVTFPVCPVCGYEQDRPPWNGASASDEICPCCGIQFGYDDWAGGDASGRPEIYKEWQRRWIEGGMKWWSKGRIRPTGWDRHEQLRRVNQEKYGGMTTNERLFAAGLLDQFDRAARSRNRQEMVLLLTQVEFAVSEAEKITDTILADPKMYGF